jgi:hypothetical protein
MWDKCASQKSRFLSVSIKATSEASEIFDDTVSVRNPLPCFPSPLLTIQELMGEYGFLSTDAL